MDLITPAYIGAAAFVLLLFVSAFIRQCMLRHDTQANEKAQSTALIQEVAELEKIRTQMQSNKRFEIHYEMLKSNKDAITNLDARIEEILAKKKELSENYVRVTARDSGLLSDAQASPERKGNCYGFKERVDEQIKYYDDELKQMQQRRAVLWETHIIFQKLLLEQETRRNESLDTLYGQHSAVFQTVCMSHITNTEAVTVKNIEASTLTFKDIVTLPIQFLMQCFGFAGRGPGGIVLPNFTFVQTREARSSRPEHPTQKSEHVLLNRQRFFYPVQSSLRRNNQENVLAKEEGISAARAPNL